MAQEMFDDKAIPWIAASKSSDQKYFDDTKEQYDILFSETAC